MSEAATSSASISARTYECTTCRWKKNITPQNTLFVEGVDIFYSCPKCGNKNISNYEKKSRLERWLDGF